MYYDLEKSGKRIQQLRKNQSITLEELSEKLNITDRQLRRIEKAKVAALLIYSQKLQ